MKKAMSHRFLLFMIFSLSVPAFAAPQEANFTARQCEEFPITRGEKGKGILRYCDNGSDQRVYVSGEMDVPEGRMNRDRDLRSICNILSRVKKRTQGTFEVVTEDAHGGDVEWHQMLMMGIEDACTGDCKIVTIMKGACESACSQLHLTCAKNAKTYMLPGANFCEHATNDDQECHGRDPNPPHDTNICDPAATVMEYKDRCVRLAGRVPRNQCGQPARNRSIAIDEARKRQVSEFADLLKNRGVFSSDKMVCSNDTPWVRPPWAEGGGQHEQPPRSSPNDSRH